MSELCIIQSGEENGESLLKENIKKKKKKKGHGNFSPPNQMFHLTQQDVLVKVRFGYTYHKDLTSQCLRAGISKLQSL